MVERRTDRGTRTTEIDSPMRGKELCVTEDGAQGLRYKQCLQSKIGAEKRSRRLQALVKRRLGIQCEQSQLRIWLLVVAREPLRQKINATAHHFTAHW